MNYRLFRLIMSFSLSIAIHYEGTPSFALPSTIIDLLE